VNSIAALNQTDAVPKQGLAGVVFGRFMLPDMTEHPCQVTDVTEDGATFITTSVPAMGLTLVAYLEELGRVEAISDSPTANGFRVKFSATGSRRDRLVARVNWLKQNQLEGSDQRRHPRFEPREKTSQITLPDGRVYTCEVVDISVSGAAIKTDVMPAVGTHMMLGKMKGKIVRYLEHGVAIQFIRQLDASSLGDAVKG
jgi:hypothetical protein